MIFITEYPTQKDTSESLKWEKFSISVKFKSNFTTEVCFLLHFPILATLLNSLMRFRWKIFPLIILLIFKFSIYTSENCLHQFSMAKYQILTILKCYNHADASSKGFFHAYILNYFFRLKNKNTLILIFASCISLFWSLPYW